MVPYKRGDAIVAVTEGKEPHRGDYSRELNASLPNVGGTAQERARDYFEKAGLKNIVAEDLSYIQRIQKARMTFGRRIGRGYDHYMIYGTR
jgi:hypothetical protein